MPAKYKFIDPTTAVYGQKDMPIVKGKDHEIKILLGDLNGVKSNIELLSPAFYYHVKMKACSRVDIPVVDTHNSFVYNISGEAETTDQTMIKRNQIALYQRGANNIPLYSEEGAELLVMGGEVLNERVYSYGPFVMNNQQQIYDCIKAYNSGQMGDPAKVN